MPRVIDIPPPQLAGRGDSGSKGVPTILVVRHGSVTEGGSESGDKKVIRGQAIDIGLSSTGKKEATEAGAKLKDCGAGKLYSSPLKRGKQTADAIGDSVGLKAEVLDNLKPWNPGNTLAGKTVGEIKDDLKYYQTNVNEKPPGGESYAKYYAYTEQAWKQLMKEAESDPSKTIIAVAHSRDILALPNIIAGKGAQGVGIKGIPVNGSISILSKSGGKWQFELAPGTEKESGGTS